MKTFLALFMGTNPPDPDAMSKLSQEDVGRGMAAWGQWMETHAAQVAETGGPVGVTKQVTAEGTTDIRNAVGGYVVVRAESHEAAARMFESHPHFTIFPGYSVEVMEVLPIPAA